MHFSTALAAIAAVAPLVSAHGNSPLPRIIGLNPKDLKARSILSNLGARISEVHEIHEERNAVNKRQATECGAGIGSCDAGYCCSPEGYCGTTGDYCYSPGCNYQYGPGCPENITPSGTNTSTIARTKVGSVEYGGAGIYNCVTPGTVALTYDDGPQAVYTSHILDVFANYPGSKATFFITGNNINKGQIDTTAEYVSVIKRMYSLGHQIASHTWTHLDLSAISSIDRKQQMWKNEMALRNILGFFPTYMRPPYSSCTGACETDMAALGYHVTYFDVDTDDYDQDSTTMIQNSKNWFKGNITKNGATAANSEWLSIGHDIHYQTAYNLTDFMLSTLTTLGYTSVTVGECLGDPEANWYRSGTGSAVSTTAAGSTSTSAPASTATAISTDGLCGGTSGKTCKGSTFGNCCSQYGYCGSTTDHCSTGCQSTFGTCGTGSSSVVTSATTKATSTSTKATSTSTKASSTSAAATGVSTSGMCGGTTGLTCQGSSFGNCCSQYGYCGTTTDHCSTGCQSAFGTCGTSAGTTSVKAASTTVKASSTTVKTSAAASATAVSQDGSCGGTNKYTCKGSSFGNCCSQYGYCGSSTTYCSTGCQSTFGTCT
ncbi:carbohydrate esterase family 4 protein [Dothidotthia symphoricarpi CBS 119687]|uniref:Carbohydrate esterase family 4 protein n=1 Tax=Dothidotthia symphoricarpi CBS 119687 TaxID=1392245 RepID=A0A6A6ANY1_9PLEO|nr:carbohydrate esterase family 4 protein [Dothidotthia symphoricarpi CBS 119687]KAF2133236.1 carbohydrate esterase family 4 protein [Dothidotthia symphoricarpi CBS 119687]